MNLETWLTHSIYDTNKFFYDTNKDSSSQHQPSLNLYQHKKYQADLYVSWDT